MLEALTRAHSTARRKVMDSSQDRQQIIAQFNSVYNSSSFKQPTRHVNSTLHHQLKNKSKTFTSRRHHHQQHRSRRLRAINESAVQSHKPLSLKRGFVVSLQPVPPKMKEERERSRFEGFKHDKDDCIRHSSRARRASLFSRAPTPAEDWRVFSKELHSKPSKVVANLQLYKVKNGKFRHWSYVP